jgi:hypothetical protein
MGRQFIPWRRSWRQMEEGVVRSGKPEVDDVVVVRMKEVTKVGVVAQVALVSSLGSFNYNISFKLLEKIE